MSQLGTAGWGRGVDYNKVETSPLKRTRHSNSNHQGTGKKEGGGNVGNFVSTRELHWAFSGLVGKFYVRIEGARKDPVERI